jgi:hypothetical protein
MAQEKTRIFPNICYISTRIDHHRLIKFKIDEIDSEKESVKDRMIKQGFRSLVPNMGIDAREGIHC